MLELTFPSNVAAPTPKLAFTPPKVPLRKTRQRKPSQIVSSPFVVPKRKNKKKAGDLPNVSQSIYGYYCLRLWIQHI
jgi:hypothetical protein